MGEMERVEYHAGNQGGSITAWTLDGECLFVVQVLRQDILLREMAVALAEHFGLSAKEVHELA